MRRMNLTLDSDLLEKAKHILGAKTSSAAVNLALEEVIRCQTIQSLPRLFGQGSWQGSLSEMREDTSRKKIKRVGK